MDRTDDNQLETLQLISTCLGNRRECLFQISGDYFVITSNDHVITSCVYKVLGALHTHLTLPEKHALIFPQN